MKNLAAVFAADVTEYGMDVLSDGPSAFDRVVRYARELPDVHDVLVLCRPGFDFGAEGRCRLIIDDNWSVAQLVEHLTLAAEQYDHVFYMYGDTPLLDSTKSREMYDNHVRYFAQYTFADGYPLGLTPEIIRADSMKLISKLASGMEGPVERGSLFEAIKKDINAFDIETDIAARDQRLLRVTLAADSRRNTQVLTRVLGSSPSSLEDVCDFLDRNAPLLRTLPAYVLVQIEEGCPQACSYCPWPAVGGDVLTRRGEMLPRDFGTVLDKVSGFADDATVALSLWGEPSLHSGIGELARILGTYDRLSLMIETSGIGWKPSDIESILDSVGGRTEWIIGIDAIEPQLYRQLRGDGQQEARDFALKMIETAPEKVHVQAVRMKDSEERLQDFYRFWKTYTENIIIQKYDHYCGMLPQRKVTDLSPLNRFPCWHLKRDLHVLIDGTVPVCREDIKGEKSLGNIFHDRLDEIWQRGESWYLKHILGDYPELCRGCDEYYTYNF